MSGSRPSQFIASHGKTGQLSLRSILPWHYHEIQNLFIEAMEFVSKDDIANTMGMMRKLQRISDVQSADPATSCEVAWQQRKCRRLLRYPTMDAVAPGEL